MRVNREGGLSDRMKRKSGREKSFKYQSFTYEGIVCCCKRTMPKQIQAPLAQTFPTHTNRTHHVWGAPFVPRRSPTTLQCFLFERYFPRLVGYSCSKTSGRGALQVHFLRGALSQELCRSSVGVKIVSKRAPLYK